MTYEINSCLTSLINSFPIYERRYEGVYRGFYEEGDLIECLSLCMFDGYDDLFKTYLNKYLLNNHPKRIYYIYEHACKRKQFQIVKIIEEHYEKIGYDPFVNSVLVSFEKMLENE